MLGDRGQSHCGDRRALTVRLLPVRGRSPSSLNGRSLLRADLRTDGRLQWLGREAVGERREAAEGHRSSQASRGRQVTGRPPRIAEKRNSSHRGPTRGDLMRPCVFSTVPIRLRTCVLECLEGNNRLLVCPDVIVVGPDIQPDRPSSARRF